MGINAFQVFNLALKYAPLFLNRGNPQNNQNNKPQSDQMILNEKDIALVSLRQKAGSVTVILGSRDTGKSQLVYRYAEFLQRPTYIVSPQAVPPSWMIRIPLEKVATDVPEDVTLICDDLPAYMSNRDYRDGLVMMMEKIVPMVRHPRQPPEFPVGKVHLIFVSQSAAQADKYILDCDMAFFKPLGLLSDDMERPNIKKIYSEFVNPLFQNKDDNFIHSHAFMMSRTFKGMIEFKMADK
jgi:hypothetical protein